MERREEREERGAEGGGRGTTSQDGGGTGERRGYTPEYTTIRRGPKSRFVPSCLSGNDGTQHANVQRFQPIKRRGWKTALRQCLPVGSWIVKSWKEWCAGGEGGGGYRSKSSQPDWDRRRVFFNSSNIIVVVVIIRELIITILQHDRTKNYCRCFFPFFFRIDMIERVKLRVGEEREREREVEVGR